MTAIALPYLQDFNAPAVPSDWLTDMSLSPLHGILDTTGLYLRLSSTLTSAYAISPLVGPVTSNTQLSFHYRILNYAGWPYNGKTLGATDKIEIQVSTDDGASFTTIHTIDQNNHTPTTEFTNKVVSLSTYNGNDIKIRFLSTWGSGDYYVDIDHVLFEDGTSMTYVGAYQEHTNLNNVGVGTTNNEIIRLQVVTQKGSSPLVMNSISVSASGEIAVARMFYTTGPTFSTAIQFGTSYNNASGGFSFIGNQVLAQGANYFWMAYDIKSTATPGNTVDGYFSSFVTSETSTPKTPYNGSPTGNRKVAAIFSGTKSIPGDYTSLAAAVTALNNGIVGSGGVIFNVAGGHTENNVGAILLTTSGSLSNPVTFRKSGSGNKPLITRTDAGGGTPAVIGNNGDAVILLEGTDYITFDSIDVATQSSGIEYGFYLRKATITNACKYVTIKNATINMTKGTGRYIVGICAGNNTSTVNNISVGNTGGRHENITLTGNVISGTFAGIFVKGSDEFNDQNFTIGTNGYGNMIQNFGGANVNETWGIYLYGNNNSQVSYNTINNMSGGGSAFTGPAAGVHNANISEVAFTVDHNTINLTSSSSPVYGIYSAMAGSLQLHHNTISNFTGNGIIAGVYIATGCNPGNIYKNEIFNLSSSSTSTSAGIVCGIIIGAGTNVYVYNNFISGLKTPAGASSDAIRGISVTSAQSNSTIGLYYNTIYLDAASSGANFGSSGIFHTSSATSTTSALDLRNNIVVNKCTPNGTSYTTAFRRSDAPLGNYKAVSNSNIFYAGVPGTYKVIYFDGAAKQTIEEYKAFVGPARDSISFSDDPVFVNVGTAPYNLRLQDGNRTYCESGARPVSSPVVVSDDFDGAARPTLPDIGADEFSGTAKYVFPPSGFSATCGGPSQINLGWSKNASSQDVLVTSLATTFTGNPVNGTAYNIGDPIPSAGMVIYKGPATAFSHSSLNFWTQHYYKIWSVDSYNFYSTGLYTNAITNADTIETMPYLQDFGPAWSHIPAAPDKWKVYNPGGSDTVTWRRQASYNYEPPACAEGSGNQNDYLVLPPVKLPNTNCRLVWWDKVEDASSNNTYRIMISTTGCEPASFTTSLDTFNCANTAWTRHELNISSYKNQTVFLAFHQFYSATTNSDFAVDEVYVDELPAGPVLSVDPVSKDFGTITVTTESDPQTFKIKNRGIGTMTITGTELTGANQDEFDLQDANTYPVNLGADQSITISVTFTPVTTGSKTAALAVSHSLTGSPESIILVGTAQTLITEWLGTISNEWGNPSNWSNGVPGTGHEAIITNGGFDPVISSVVTVYKVTVASGADFHVALDGDLIITGE
jgi:hypothetical protein